MEERGGAAMDPLAYRPWHGNLKLRTTQINKFKCLFIVWRLWKNTGSFLGSREAETLEENNQPSVRYFCK